jgi:hypothetical protein
MCVSHEPRTMIFRHHYGTDNQSNTKRYGAHRGSIGCRRERDALFLQWSNLWYSPDSGWMTSELPWGFRTNTCRGNRAAHLALHPRCGQSRPLERKRIVSALRKAAYHPRKRPINSMAPERRQVRAQRACTYCRQRKVRLHV